MSGLVDTLSIENVVTSTEIGQELELEMVADDLERAEYDPDPFFGLIYRVQDTTCLLFRSGKVISTGSSSVSAAEDAVTRFFADLGDIGVDVPGGPDLVVRNMVVTGDLRQQLNLNAVAIGLGLEHVEYEPEQFPGLVYRSTGLDTVVLLFGSGKVVITGGNQFEDAKDSITQTYSELADIGLVD